MDCVEGISAQVSILTSNSNNRNVKKEKKKCNVRGFAV